MEVSAFSECFLFFLLFSSRTSIKASLVLLPLLGLTWSLAFLTLNFNDTMKYLFTYLFTITNSFQGVLFFVFHCLLNVDVSISMMFTSPQYLRKVVAVCLSVVSICVSVCVCLSVCPSVINILAKRMHRFRRFFS